MPAMNEEKKMPVARLAHCGSTREATLRAAQRDEPYLAQIVFDIVTQQQLFRAMHRPG